MTRQRSFGKVVITRLRWALIAFVLIGLLGCAGMPQLLLASESTPEKEGVLQVDDALLREVLPSAKAPRLMRLEDLRDEWDREYFKLDGLSFVLKSDFDRDGHEEYAVAGKDDSLPSHSSAFVAILTLGQGQPHVRYFARLPEARVSLLLLPRCRKQFDGIGLVYTTRSDHGQIVVWGGRRFELLKQCDGPGY